MPLTGTARQLAVFFVMTIALFPLRAGTLYWGGGSGDWTGNANWHQSSDLSDTAIVWTDGSDAVIDADSPRLNANVQADSLHLAETATVIFNGGKTLEIQGPVTGSGALHFGSGTESFFYIHSSLTQTLGLDFIVTGVGTAKAALRVGGKGFVTWNGHMEVAGREVRILIDAETRLELGPDCTVNNNMPDLINARPFRVEGAGLTSLLSFHPGFNADMADPNVREDTHGFAWPPDDPGDGTYVKPVGGMSTIRFENTGIQTSATQNLATIHKYSGHNPKKYTHHGLWMINQNNGPVSWTVTGSAQEYDSGIYYNQDWTLITDSNYRQAAIWHDGVNITFGTRTSNTTLTKQGQADFILAGTQSYHPGSAIHVEEGGVVFLYDPDSSSSPTAVSNNGWMSGTGNYLELTVDGGASAEFLPPAGETYRIHSGTLQGTLRLTARGSNSTGTALVETAGSVSITGPLEVAYEGVLNGAEYQLLHCGGTLTWSPSSVSAPAGWQVEKDGDTLWLRQDGSALSYADWAASALAGETETAPTDDPFDQHIDNLSRYAYDLDTDPNAPPPVDVLPEIVEIDGAPHLRFRRAAASRRPDLVIRVQMRESLVTGIWSDVDPALLTVTPEDGDEIVTLLLSSLSGASPLFLRVETELL